MDPLKSITWDQLTAIVTSAIALGTLAITSICAAIIKLAPLIKQTREALREIGTLRDQVAAHKETLVNLADASDAPNEELLKPLEK